MEDKQTAERRRRAEIAAAAATARLAVATAAPADDTTDLVQELRAQRREPIVTTSTPPQSRPPQSRPPQSRPPVAKTAPVVAKTAPVVAKAAPVAAPTVMAKAAPVAAPTVVAKATPTVAPTAVSKPAATPRPNPDRIAGAVLGLALGDALGLQVEGSEPFAIAERHPDGLAIPYRGAYRGYESNDWTDATDLAVLVMRSLAAYLGGAADNPSTDFASRVARWCRTGFSELGDTGGLTPEPTVLRAAAAPSFQRDPEGAAAAVADPTRPGNGGLIRTLACAFTVAPSEWAALYCRATHADPRCRASAVALSELCAALARLPDGAAVAPSIATGAIRAGRLLLADEAQRRHYSQVLLETKQLDEMKLAEEPRSHTFKPLACAVWALRALTKAPARDADFFRRTLASLAAEGGDASANCAVAGAVLGAALGRAALPQDWLVALPHRAWLEHEVSAFTEEVARSWDA